MGRFTLAIEQLKFQSTAFKDELAVVFDDIRQEGKGKKGLEDSDSTVRLAKVIGHYTNLNFSVEFGQLGPMVEIPSLNKNNPLVGSNVRDWASSTTGLELVRSAGGSVKGSVNLNTGKVSGVFTQMKVRLYLPIPIMIGLKFSSAELAAVVLHEVGHIWTYCAYMAHMIATNRVLAGLAAGFNNAKTPDERETLLISVSQALKIDIDAKQLSMKSPEAATVVVVTNVARQTQDEFGANLYDLNTWEMLSDQYAARNGAGPELVTALAKLYQGNISFRSTPEFIAMEALKATLFFGSIFVTVAGGGLFSFGVGKVGFGAAILLILMDGVGDGTYDRPGMRFKRVRDQVVQAMKDKKLSKDDIERLVEDLAAIDEVLATVNDREQLFGKLWNFFSKDARKRMIDEKLAREVEDIAHNELFVKSAQFRQLAAQG